MKPVWKWGLSVAIGLLVVLLCANWWVNRRWVPGLETRLNNALAAAIDSVYRLTYDSLRMSFFSGSAVANNVRLIPDTAAQKTLYDVRIAQLRVGGVGLLRLLFSGKLSVNTIILDKPMVKLTVGREPDTARRDTAAPLLERLQDVLDGVRVTRIAVKRGQMELAAQRDARHLVVRRIDGTIRDVRIDSAARRDTTRLYYAKGWDVDVAGVSYLRPDSSYRFALGALRLDMHGRELLMRDLRYGPTVGKGAFYSRVGRAADMIDMRMGLVKLAGFDVARWTADGLLAAAALHIDTAEISIYKDKRLPNPPENKLGKSPHQQLMAWKQRLRIDSARLHALDVAFTEVSDKTGKAGTVTFERTAAVIRNLTNDTATLRGDRFMTLDAQTKVMGAGDLSVRFRFDMLDSLGGHTYTAKLGPMDGRAFNRMLTPHLNVEVEQARIRGMRFEMKANDRRTEGTLRFDYQGLKVNLLAGSGPKAGERKSVVSFFANRFLLNDSNPDANGEYHAGTVYIARPKTFSFFKMIWRSIREGTKECIGLGG
ncbi:hypothetical protein SAMN05421747_109139 [Parapedobacter composti]|uniref:AsmA-like C-terminal domain-containing protein n=1 Tax=Parapedobacter composti TaxID=623281 RepID=A0A1I1ILH0_9SPHI|nr:hypothetical protein [Parapedobacter composti]SFC37045.1 hypothetical protein SAMN05421747_109139 [Parapedobacter composti]